MAEALPAADHSTLAIERELYRRLLNLGREKELLPLLREALALIVEVTGVSQGYLELYDDDDEPNAAAKWGIAHGFSDSELDAVRSAISRGIIAEAVAGGETVVTPSAYLDPRFKTRESVKIGKIEAVLCTPIGEDPPRGVLYLQGRAKPGLFTPDERERAEVFAHHLARLVDALLAEQRQQAGFDPTAELRAGLAAPGVVGRSQALAAVLKQISAYAPLDVTVVLTGESGTGKSVLARVLHDNGPRAGKPFIEVNCGALPEALLENELFGALRGAHSTASHRIEGKVAAAERGTLFLDEIGALPLSAQAKLLQLLQSKQYFPLGGSKPINADVRIIAATNVNLRQAVADKAFREDLYYRLQVLAVRVPSLSERREDIPELMAFFCDQTCQRHSLPRLQVSRDAVRAAQEAEWPGNVRQLENAVESAAVRCASEKRAVLERSDLFPGGGGSPDETDTNLSLQAATRRFQERLVQRVLDETNWSVAEAARRLDVARSHVYNLIRAFGLRRSDAPH
jgi:Nif-specific regulatory protein